MDDNKLIAVILAILFPPAGVAVKEGISDSFWINCILTLLGWFPGVLHALWVILR